MKSVIKEIVASLEEQAQHKLIEDVRIGLCYTAVILNDGNLGFSLYLSLSRASFIPLVTHLHPDR